MHIVLAIVAAVALFVLGYACRGWDGWVFAASHEEVESWAKRISTALARGEGDLRSDIGKILTELRAKL